MSEKNGQSENNETHNMHFQDMSGLIYTSRVDVEDVSLVVVQGPHQGQELRLTHELTTVGRNEWCDLPLPLDTWISGEHCEVWLEKDQVRVRDLQSRNGTFLGGYRVFEALLTPNVPLRLGETVLELRSHDRRSHIEVHHLDGSGHLVGRSQPMRKLFAWLSRLGKRDVTVLTTGETGTGKSLLARSLHEQSSRRDGPFVVVNCGALPAALIESELFGYEKGAFTGADKSYGGMFGAAHRGTLFLDEISSLPLDLQPKLLDVLERKRYRPLGSKEEKDTDFRLVSASLGSLSDAVKRGAFREDLYYRLAVVELKMPPLRERQEDLPLIAQRLLEQLVPDAEVHLNTAAIEKLQHYIWPGNIRELRNVLERTVTFLEDFTIRPEDIEVPDYESHTATTSVASTSDKVADDTKKPESLQVGDELEQGIKAVGEQSHRLVVALEDENGERVPLKKVLELCERMILRHQVRQTDGDVEQAAQQLQISKGWYYNRIKKYGLRKDKY
ncbi:MAG: sigma 54-dependent Fis family transcriptional regulator [Deltaproteobacteria bacterium]|nr:MAG: sigma 54-dependent Fis family transcriptional regulator [Deltaproteobacteria bacterium]